MWNAASRGCVVGIVSRLRDASGERSHSQNRQRDALYRPISGDNYYRSSLSLSLSGLSYFAAVYFPNRDE